MAKQEDLVKIGKKREKESNKTTKYQNDSFLPFPVATSYAVRIENVQCWTQAVILRMLFVVFLFWAVLFLCYKMFNVERKQRLRIFEHVICFLKSRVENDIKILHLAFPRYARR